MSAKTSGADSTPNGDARNRQHNDGSSARAYTVEQKAAVLRIRKCSKTDFYEILGISEHKPNASSAQIKKAYHKLSLLTHPDKNGYEGSAEAFKMVSHAFQVLSDEDKKAFHDKTGGDPDNRHAAAAGAGPSSPFSGFARSPGMGRRGPMFEEELTPEEMFRQFFGGMGGFGGPFGNTPFDQPGFVFNMGGGPGIRIHQFGGGRPRRRPAGAGGPQEAPTTGNALASLLPLLLIVLLPLLSNLFTESTSSLPGFVYQDDGPKPPFTHNRKSYRYDIGYWVSPKEVEDMSQKSLKNLDRVVEGRYVNYLANQCELETQRQQQMYRAAHGWFQVDQEKLSAARSMPLPRCKELDKLRYGK